MAIGRLSIADVETLEWAGQSARQLTGSMYAERQRLVRIASEISDALKVVDGVIAELQTVQARLRMVLPAHRERAAAPSRKITAKRKKSTRRR